MSEATGAAGNRGAAAALDPEIRPFRLEIPQADLEDLHQRLHRTRWPDELPVVGWSHGAPLGYVRELADYWRNRYDWRANERRLNEFPQFTTTIDDQRLHLLQARSREPGAMPLIVTHGWPGSVAEFMRIIGPFTFLESLPSPGQKSTPHFSCPIARVWCPSTQPGGPMR